MEFMLLIIIMHLLDIGHGTNSAWCTLQIYTPHFYVI